MSKFTSPVSKSSSRHPSTALDSEDDEDILAPNQNIQNVTASSNDFATLVSIQQENYQRSQDSFDQFRHDFTQALQSILQGIQNLSNNDPPQSLSENISFSTIHASTAQGTTGKTTSHSIDESSYDTDNDNISHHSYQSSVRSNTSVNMSSKTSRSKNLSTRPTSHKSISSDSDSKKTKSSKSRKSHSSTIHGSSKQKLSASTLNTTKTLLINPKPMLKFNIGKWTKEMKDLTISSEAYSAVMSWYDYIQQSMVIATERHDIIPDVEHLSKRFTFKRNILPRSSHPLYAASLIEYKSLSKALRIYLHKTSSISSNCSVLISRRKIHQHEKDGFKLLHSMLAGIFPRLGGPQLDIISKISSVKPRAGETLDSLLHTFLDLHETLRISGHQVPATALLQKYISILKKNERLFSIISPIHRRFHQHLVTDQMHLLWNIPFTKFMNTLEIQASVVIILYNKIRQI